MLRTPMNSPNSKVLRGVARNAVDMLPILTGNRLNQLGDWHGYLLGGSHSVFISHVKPILEGKEPDPLQTKINYGYSPLPNSMERKVLNVFYQGWVACNLCQMFGCSLTSPLPPKVSVTKLQDVACSPMKHSSQKQAVHGHLQEMLQSKIP